MGFGNNGLAKANLHGANDQKVLAGGDRESVGAGFTDSGKYETAIRRRIKQLREDKKMVSNTNTLASIEKEIKSLKGKLLNNTDNAVLYYFIEHIDYDNKVDMDKVKKTQKAIADELCLDNAEVSRAFKKLKELNLISFSKSGHALEKVWVSPFILWRGKAGAHYKLMKELKEEFRGIPFETKLKAA
ncbi:hypothetical protein RVM27_00325 [Halomonas sp. KM007]